MDRVSDEELLRMLREVEDVEEAQEEVVQEAVREAARADPGFDPCPACGEPAQYLGECHVCGEEGCLPPDLWEPGMADACLTLCVRCARSVHLACTAEDGAGNPRCPTCAF